MAKFFSGKSLFGIVTAGLLLFSLSGCRKDENETSLPFYVNSTISHKYDGDAGFDIVRLNPVKDEEGSYAFNGDTIQMREENLSRKNPNRDGYRDVLPDISSDNKKICFSRFNGPYGTYEFDAGKFDLILSDISGENQEILATGRNFTKCSFNRDNSKIVTTIIPSGIGETYSRAITNLSTIETLIFPGIEGYITNLGASFINSEEIIENVTRLEDFESILLVRNINNPSSIVRILEKSEGININSQPKFLDNEIFYYDKFGNLVTLDYISNEKRIFSDGFFNTDPSKSKEGTLYYACRRGGDYARLCMISSNNERFFLTDDSTERGYPVPISN